MKDSAGNCLVNVVADLKLYLYDSRTDSLEEWHPHSWLYCSSFNCKYCFEYDQEEWAIFESASRGFSDTIQILEYRLKPPWLYDKNCCKCDKEIEYMRFRHNSDVYEGRYLEIVH